MAIVVAHSETVPSRTLKMPDGSDYFKRSYLGGLDKPAAPDPRQPQIYSVAQLPGAVAEPHYHVVEQWQVFVQGSGTLGRHSAVPGAVHYADRYTGYGPIVAGPEGITYFSIRAISDPGAQYLSNPLAKENLKQQERTAKRYLYFGAERVGADRPTADLKDARLDAIVPPHPDGLAAWVAHMGPRSRVSTPAAEGSSGQAILVLSGSVEADATELPPQSCAFIAPADPALQLIAGAMGAVALILQFPAVRAS